QVDVNLAALDRLNTQLRLNGEYQIRAIERRERLEHQLAAAGAAPAPPPLRESPRQTRLASLHEQLADLQRRYSDRYPDIIRLNREIASLEEDGPADGSAEPGVRPVESGARVTE